MPFHSMPSRTTISFICLVYLQRIFPTSSEKLFVEHRKLCLSRCFHGQRCKNLICRRREHDKVSSNIFEIFECSLRRWAATRCCFLFFLFFIHSNFPYIIFLPYWIKTVAIIYRHFRFPHPFLRHQRLINGRDESCRRKTSRTNSTDCLRIRQQ